MSFGVFQDMVPIVNRAPVPLTVKFDGQETVVKSGQGFLPSVTINYANNQNPVMGSVDPNNPSISGGEYLIGVQGRDNCSMLSTGEWNAHCDAISRVDLKTLMEDELGPGERVEVRGKGRKTAARNSFEASGFKAGMNREGMADRIE
jgi:hypothetical protein